MISKVQAPSNPFRHRRSRVSRKIHLNVTVPPLSVISVPLAYTQMKPIAPDRSEIVRLGKVLLPVLHATRPALAHLDNQDNWLAHAPPLLLLFDDYARKHG